MTPGSIWTPNDVPPYSSLNPNYSPNAFKHILLVPDKCAESSCRSRVPYFFIFSFSRNDKGDIKAAFVCPDKLHRQNAIEAVRSFSMPKSGVWYTIELTGHCCAPDCHNTAYRYGMYVDGSEVLGGELCLAHDILNSGTPRTTADWQKNPHSF